MLFDFHLKSRTGSTGVIFAVTSNHPSLATPGLIRKEEPAGKPERFSVVAMESVNTAGLSPGQCVRYCCVHLPAGRAALSPQEEGKHLCLQQQGSIRD